MDRRALWIVLVAVCFVLISETNAARRSSEDESHSDNSDSVESKSRSEEEIPVRLGRKFRGNSHTRRLHIENQHGFDGKVEKIHINSDERHPRIRAYGMPKKILADNGHIERTQQGNENKDSESRNTRAIEAYGKSKDQLKSNGEIERVLHPAPMIHQAPRVAGTRVTRSIETEVKEEAKEQSGKDTDDLEAQEKVFRPLFVYRQQTAKRQHRGRNQIYGYQASQKPCQERRLVY